jgi:hypothetical protein
MGQVSTPPQSEPQYSHSPLAQCPSVVCNFRQLRSNALFNIGRTRCELLDALYYKVSTNCSFRGRDQVRGGRAEGIWPLVFASVVFSPERKFSQLKSDGTVLVVCILIKREAGLGLRRRCYDGGCPVKFEGPVHYLEEFGQILDPDCLCTKSLHIRYAQARASIPQSSPHKQRHRIDVESDAEGSCNRASAQ